MWSLPRPLRHHDIIRLRMKHTGERTMSHDEQGFLTQHGVFMTRKEAEDHARDSGQLDPDAPLIGSVLTSEDLW